ncbi:hypothetical protein MHYP_G00059780 [Metynnis hypsauchen]
MKAHLPEGPLPQECTKGQSEILVLGKSKTICIQHIEMNLKEDKMCEKRLTAKHSTVQTQRPQARSLFLSTAETSGRQHPGICGEAERAPNHIVKGFDIQSMARL